MRQFFWAWTSALFWAVEATTATSALTRLESFPGFELLGSAYVAWTNRGLVSISPGGFTLGAGGSNEKAELRWTGASAGLLDGEDPSGIVNYFTRRSPANWRTGVPRFKRVTAKGLYDGVGLV